MYATPREFTLTSKYNLCVRVCFPVLVLPFAPLFVGIIYYSHNWYNVHTFGVSTNLYFKRGREIIIIMVFTFTVN